MTEPHRNKPASGSSALDSNREQHSYSEPEKVRVRHVHLILEPAFEQRCLKGQAVLDVQRSAGWLDTPIVLDTRDLEIKAVDASIDGSTYTPAVFELGPADAILGRPLVIGAPPTVTRLRVSYSTSPDASGLQWLDAEQTASRVFPFLFTQSQAIHARSWIPYRTRRPCA